TNRFRIHNRCIAQAPSTTTDLFAQRGCPALVTRRAQHYNPVVPALLGPLIGFCLGVVFAWVSLGKGSVDRLATKHRGALLSAAFGSLLYAPICAYFVAFAADWSVAYWIDASRLPPVIAPLWVLLDASTPAVGFLLATSGERSKNSHFLRIRAGPALGALALLAVSYPRLGLHATYRQSHADFGLNHVA